MYRRSIVFNYELQPKTSMGVPKHTCTGCTALPIFRKFTLRNRLFTTFLKRSTIIPRVRHTSNKNQSWVLLVSLTLALQMNRTLLLLFLVDYWRAFSISLVGNSIDSSALLWLIFIASMQKPEKTLAIFSANRLVVANAKSAKNFFE